VFGLFSKPAGVLGRRCEAFLRPPTTFYLLTARDYVLEPERSGRAHGYDDQVDVGSTAIAWLGQPKGVS
jgi:hypothetical protein